MPDALAVWDSFSGGHWGNLGPVNAPENQWGGVNMLYTRQGNLTPCCASRLFEFSNDTPGKIWGDYWAWGSDGFVYFVQQNAGASTFALKAFNPDIDAIPITQTTIGALTGPVLVEPDWVALADFMYVTIWGDKTYSWNGTTLATLSGSYGNAAAGRSICMYGDRLLVGGVSDARFGVHPNRIHFSGDDTNNDPINRLAWEDLNFFDVGADGTAIAGMYPLRDHLVVILADQQIWIITGVPGVNATSRRVYGFHKGKGGSGHFQPSHAVVDPAQTRLWMFDHGYRGPARFNGATLTRLPQFGSPNSARIADDIVDGACTPLSGADEFLMHGVAMSREAGEGVIGTSMELLRYNGAYGLVQRAIIGAH